MGRILRPGGGVILNGDLIFMFGGAHFGLLQIHEQENSFDFVIKFTTATFTVFVDQFIAKHIKLFVNRYKFFAYRNSKESIYLEKFVKYQQWPLGQPHP